MHKSRESGVILICLASKGRLKGVCLNFAGLCTNVRGGNAGYQLDGLIHR